MISKELLSEIMDDKVKSIRIMNNTIFIYFENNNQEYFIDIYELTHKCKAWALSQGYYFELNICLSVVHLKLWKDVGITKLFKSFKGSKEIEVYYKACQWILENKKLKEEE